MPSHVFQDLQTALKGALSGSLEALMLGLMKSPAQYDALELKAALKARARQRRRAQPGPRGQRRLRS